ncbi:MAG: YebC/PmpR family DNA-binding transcriptional regulator [Deltaproteobacteria bacterium]|nr:MAG: YebC/PmpR family DNA-binding transcriptional regulator [Deltaproteobacteria bacterium]TNF30076.1 MAG: YebC/PmpR family DNA-binding transcriptional regulator [Deltaproteobacteria bacterium]
MGRKSAKIAAKKGASDRAKAQIYTRALADVYKASKSGSPDPETNFLLKVAIDRCKKFNVPKDNIDRAIKKGQGSDGAGYEDITYEGYGPNGVAIFIEASTDNVTRTAGNVRSYFNKCGGSLGVNGSLEFIFERKAVYEIPAEGIDEDDFTLHMIDAGAEDVELEEGFFVVKGPMEVFGSIQEKLQEINVTPEEAGLVRIPLNYKEVDEATRAQIDKLIGLLEDDEDVITVYDNLAEDDEE